jgi:hypothetical protein
LCFVIFHFIRERIHHPTLVCAFNNVSSIVERIFSIFTTSLKSSTTNVFLIFSPLSNFAATNHNLCASWRIHAIISSHVVNFLSITECARESTLGATTFGSFIGFTLSLGCLFDFKSTLGLGSLLGSQGNLWTWPVQIFSHFHVTETKTVSNGMKKVLEWYYLCIQLNVMYVKCLDAWIVSGNNISPIMEEFTRVWSGGKSWGMCVLFFMK